jgi:acetyl esterase/lipase
MGWGAEVFRRALDKARGPETDRGEVSTTIHRFPVMFHGFVSFLCQLDAADQAVGEIGAALRSAMT